MAPVKYSFVNDEKIEHCIRCPFFVLDPYPSYNRGYCFHPQMPRRLNGERPRFSVMGTNKFYFKKPDICPLVEEKMPMKIRKEIEIYSTDDDEILRRCAELEADGWVNVDGKPIEKVSVEVIGVIRGFEKEVKEDQNGAY